MVDSALQAINQKSSIVIVATNTLQRWHIDFCMDEIENMARFGLLKFLSSNKDIYYSIVLNGPATLFYPSEEAARQEIQEAAENNTENIIYNSNFNISKVETPNDDQGAAFLCGIDHGAIHTSPPPSSDRLVIIISPANKIIINILKELILESKNEYAE